MTQQVSHAAPCEPREATVPGSAAVRAEDAQGAQRLDAPPLERRCRARRLPRDRPAAVLLLVTLEPIEVPVDHRCVEQVAPRAVRRRREVQRRLAVAGIQRVGSEPVEVGQPRRAPALRSPPPDRDPARSPGNRGPRQRRGRPRRRPTVFEVREAPLGRPVQPRVRDAELAEPAGDAGGRVQPGFIRPVRPVVGPGIVLDDREGERHRAIRGRHAWRASRTRRRSSGRPTPRPR